MPKVPRVPARLGLDPRRPAGLGYGNGAPKFVGLVRVGSDKLLLVCHQLFQMCHFGTIHPRGDD